MVAILSDASETPHSRNKAASPVFSHASSSHSSFHSVPSSLTSVKPIPRTFCATLGETFSQ